jgi:hypothetical protein
MDHQFRRGTRVLVAADYDRIGSILAPFDEDPENPTWLVLLDSGQLFAFRETSLTETSL